uniref:Uncharacterized protein n=1 Tax=Arundo donax TaxID=35708 RepID=A0A0A9DQK2_ARUDO
MISYSVSCLLHAYRMSIPVHGWSVINSHIWKIITFCIAISWNYHNLTSVLLPVTQFLG